MAKSSRPSNGSKESKSSKASKDHSTVRNSRTTVSGPAEPDASGRGDVTAEKAAATQDVASTFTFNPNKAAEYDPAAALAPPEGASVKPSDPISGPARSRNATGPTRSAAGGRTSVRTPQWVRSIACASIPRTAC